MSRIDEVVDGATEYETAGWVLRQHETSHCPMCDGGGCRMVDWALTVRSAESEHSAAGSTVRGMTSTGPYGALDPA